MKKLCVVMVLTCILMCAAIGANAAADASGRPTPWEDSKLKICVAETFSEFEDAEIDILESYLWFSPDFASAAKWEAGRFVITDSPSIERYAFRFITGEMGQALMQEEQNSALGMGFYIENNTSQAFYAGPYMVGTSANAVVAQGRPIYLVDLEGNITKAEDTEGMGMALIPSGFRGHVVFFKEDLTGAGGTGDIPEGNYIGYPGFELVYSAVDASKNESIVLDNVFFFGYDFNDKARELIDQPVQSDYPAPQPDESSPSPSAEPEQTEEIVPTQQPETQAPASSTDAPLPSSSGQIDSSQNGGLGWYILGAALILCAAAVIIIVMVKKNKGGQGE